MHNITNAVFQAWIITGYSVMPWQFLLTSGPYIAVEETLGNVPLKVIFFLYSLCLKVKNVFIKVPIEVLIIMRRVQNYWIRLHSLGFKPPVATEYLSPHPTVH